MSDQHPPASPDSIVYLNGQYIRRGDATLDIEDRAAMFGDGVYEVLHYYSGKALAMDLHMARLRRSLAGVRIDEPADIDDLPAISDRVAGENGWAEACVYWKITRGAAPRDRAFPAGIPPTVLVMAWPVAALDPAAPVPTQTAILVEDQRWLRCNFKTIMLLDSVLAKQQALDAGADDAIYQRDGIVTESTAANLFIVKDGKLHTHPEGNLILSGITRAIVLELAQGLGLPATCHPFTTDNLAAADEVFITGTTSHVTAITHIDGQPVATATPGPVTTGLHEAIIKHIREHCA